MKAFNDVKDSGEREEYMTGSVRDRREGKGQFDWLPPYAILRVAQHFENGGVKYGPRNWELGQPVMGYINSAIRHSFKLLGGSKDEDHAAAICWNIMAYMETLHRIDLDMLPKELDDRPEVMKDPTLNLFGE